MDELTFMRGFSYNFLVRRNSLEGKRCMDLKGKKVLVVGLARSGIAAIKLLHKLQAQITVSEAKKVEDAQTLQLLQDCNAQLVDQELAIFQQDYDLCVKNPGVPYRSEKMEALRQCQIPIITEIELAYQLMKPQHILAITGTNGKTTTTTIVYEILKQAFGDLACVGGNIGTPLCELVLQKDMLNQSGHYIALEMSNFQLVNIDQFHPEVATITNLTPDHIDFMGGLDNYYRSKIEIYRNMQKDDVFIFNQDDEVLKQYAEKFPIHCRKETFSLENAQTDHYLLDGYLWAAKERVLPLDCIKLVGKHNLQNIMIASAMAKAVGVDNQTITQTIAQFKGVEHRIEFVRELDGVKYYNDSKGTNTDATITALKAFDHGVILLVGGFEKGLSMDEMKKHLGSVKQVIGFGAAGKRIAEDLVGSKAIVVKDLPQAVNWAKKIAVSGDTVLLSPTTSSFDQYSCFEQRGDHFKEIVKGL